jgi:surfeit locus 1 family protein
VKRLPVLATFMVLVAVAIMAGLGFWQLARAQQKDSLLSRYQANLAAPPVFIRDRVDLERHLFRRASVLCPGPKPTRTAGAGRFGFRLLADCLTLDGGATLAVQLGTSRALARPDWPGGRVTGYLAFAPDNRSLLRQLFDHRPTGPMIVADPPLLSLAANPGPSLEEVPNNHRSYAFQWFAFALTALIIYGLALRGRERRA